MDEIELRRGDMAFQDMVSYVPEGPSEIAGFYAGATIFITGGTGFLGKLIIEKLLRSCPDVKKIYVLVRPKKGKDIETRFQEIFKEPIFLHVKKDILEHPVKVEAIEGDCALLGLGISEKDNIKLQNEVNIVIHGAATVRFDEALKIATEINVRGTREILELAKHFSALKAFVHISTAYSHCPKIQIDEKFYVAPFQPDNLIKLVDITKPSDIEKLTPSMIKPWPNTYAYTKAIAEEVVRASGKDMPVAVVRPSIVTATAREPLAGWVDNVYGPTGVLVGSGVGLLRTLHGDPDCVADLVPADNVVNSIIVAAWDIAKERNLDSNSEASMVEKEPKICNYVSGAQNPLTWAEMMKLSCTLGLTIPLSRAIWYYGCFSMNKYKFVHDMRVLLWHMLPAILVDLVMRIIGKKPILMDAYRKIKKFSGVISYFATQSWQFTDENTQIMFNKLSLEDKKTFDFDISQLRWDEYMETYMSGGRMYLMKENPDTLPAATVRMRRLQMAHYTLMTLLYLGLLYVLYTIFNYVM